MKKLNLNAIRIDGGTQPRERINMEAVGDYAEAIKVGIEFPPVIVFHDGAEYWLADGFHRYHAHKQAGKASIDAEVRAGTCRDAKLFSAGANGRHGLPRSAEDKRRCVAMLLDDPEWAKWSQERIAKQCDVSAGFVSKLVAERRASLHGEEIKPAVRTVERAGKTFQQDTSRIGKGAAPKVESDSTPAPTDKREPAKKLAPWDKTPAPTNAPTTADDAFDGFDPIAELEATQKCLEEAEKRIDALTADDTKAELNKQIGIRQGIEARLSLEMAKVAQLQKELDAYGRWFAELRKVSGLEKRSEITRLVRESANARSAAV